MLFSVIRLVEARLLQALFASTRSSHTVASTQQVWHARVMVAISTASSRQGVFTLPSYLLFSFQGPKLLPHPTHH